MATIGTSELPTPTPDEEKQLLDIAKEIFTVENRETKSNLNAREIAIYSRCYWFANRYDVQELIVFIQHQLVLKRSLKGNALREFSDVLKNIKPSFEQKEGQGQFKL